jgi:protein phosphatase 1A
VLSTKNLEAVTASIQRAFAAVDAKLCTWLVSVLELRFTVD